MVKMAYRLGRVIAEQRMWKLVNLLLDELHSYANEIDRLRDEVQNLKGEK